MKKILSMLIIIMLLMNSSVLMLTSLAVDEENNVSMAEMELSKNQLKNWHEQSKRPSTCR